MTAARALRNAPAPVRTRQATRMFRVVSAKPSTKKLTMPVIVMVIVLIAVISLPLLINTQLAMLSYQIHDDSIELKRVTEINQALQVAIDEKSSAENLREAAEKAHMVPSGEAGQISLKNKQITGGVAATE